jgi:hypothetical protein
VCEPVRPRRVVRRPRETRKRARERGGWKHSLSLSPFAGREPRPPQIMTFQRAHSSQNRRTDRPRRSRPHMCVHVHAHVDPANTEHSTSTTSMRPLGCVRGSARLSATPSNSRLLRDCHFAGRAPQEVPARSPPHTQAQGHDQMRLWARTCRQPMEHSERRNGGMLAHRRLKRPCVSAADVVAHVARPACL